MGVFHYCSLEGNTAMLGGLHARLFGTFLVYIIHAYKDLSSIKVSLRALLQTLFVLLLPSSEQ